jgi:hypothetical protein
MKKFLLSILPGALFSIAAPVIFYLVNPDNRILIAWTEIFGSILLTLAAFGILYGLAYLITRQAAAAGIIATIFIFGIFYLWQIALALVLIVLICIGSLRLLRKEINLPLVNGLLAGLSVIVAGFYGWQLVTFLLQQPSIHTPGLVEPLAASQAEKGSLSEPPDIYYIILDGYGRADMLEQIYGFDNSGFIDELKALGFAVTTGSRANYPQTVLSLGSSLNMQYLDKMAEKMGSSNVWGPAKDILAHSQTRQFLEARGYRTIFIASGFDYTDIRDGNKYFKPFPLMLNNFDSGYLRFTNLAMLGNMGGLIPYPSYSTLRRTIQANFEALPLAAMEAGPKFVFAHITAPHPPFVFDASGDPVNPPAPFTMVDKMREIMEPPEYKASYVAEMKYINRRTLEMLKTILKNSSKPPVIILQGDHGPGLYLSETAASSCLYERYSILNAYYVPGIDPASIPQDITPVNSFRWVFNDTFSTNFPLLPDRSYFASFTHFYDFQDVSEDIQPVCRQGNQP